MTIGNVRIRKKIYKNKQIVLGKGNKKQETFSFSNKSENWTESTKKNKGLGFRNKKTIEN